MIRLRVYCFGAFMAVLDGEVLTGFRSDKARALLAYLLLAGERPIPRTVLQELFWEGYEPSSARANLRVTLSNLAKLMEPLSLLHITRQSVQLDLSTQEMWSDVWALEALAQQKALDHQGLSEARKLYMGDFLAGLQLEDSAPIEDWRDKEAQKYRQLFIRLFPHNLPRQGTTFIGREEEVDAIMRKVLAPDYSLITLMGTGGVGKTRLALSVGQQARGHFNDGVWWVPLAGLERGCVIPQFLPPQESGQASGQGLPERLAQAIGRPLNLTFTPNQPLTEQLFKHLANFEALLLLDNLEHLLPARLDEESGVVDFILDLLAQTERLKILVTSRQRLNVPQEFLFDIEGLPLPHRSEGANKSPALQLFAERANRLGPRFALSALNLPFVTQICQELAGLPLGIELAASLVATQSVAQIAESIAQNRLALAASWRSLPSRQRSLWALFEHSWQLLTPRQQETFAQLAIFRDGATLRAASSVINAQKADLLALQAKSLLQDSEGRLQMHPLVYDFAAQKLAQMGENVLQERHASYYLAFVAEQEQKIEFAPNREPLIETERELNNIRAAWRSAVSHRQVALLGESASAVRLLAERLGLIQEGIEAMESAIKQLRGQAFASETLAVLLLQQALLLHQTIQFDLALSSIQQAAQLATNPQTLGWVTYHWSRIYNAQNNYSGAQDKLLQARKLFGQTGDEEGQKKALHHLAILTSSLEEYAKAGHYLEQLDALDEQNSRFKGAISLNLGVCHRMQGHYQQALHYQQKGLTLFHQIGEPYWEGLAMVNHAILALHLGNYEQASSYFAQTEQLWSQGGVERYQDALYALWGLLHHHLGDHKSGLIMAEQAKEISQAKGDPYYLGFAYLVRGHAKRALGCKDSAKSAYQEALSAWQSISKKKISMEALAGLAAVAYQRQRLDEALNNVEQIMTHRFDNPTLSATIEPMRILLTCIKVLEATGQIERADALLEESYQLLMQRANDLEDEKQRESFLQRVSFHREIVRRWHAARRAQSFTRRAKAESRKESKAISSFFLLPPPRPFQG